MVENLNDISNNSHARVPRNAEPHYVLDGHETSRLQDGYSILYRSHEIPEAQRTIINNAIDLGSRLIDSSVSCLQTVPLTDEAKKIIGSFFGQDFVTEFPQIEGLMRYFCGQLSKVGSSLLELKQNESWRLNIMQDIGAAEPKDYAYGLPSPGSNGKAEKMFISKDLVDKQHALELAHTIIHEMSHIALDTRDFYYMMDPLEPDSTHDEVVEYLEYSRYVASKKIEILDETKIRNHKCRDKYIAIVGNGALSGDSTAEGPARRRTEFRCNMDKKASIIVQNADTFAAVAAQFYPAVTQIPDGRTNDYAVPDKNSDVKGGLVADNLPNNQDHASSSPASSRLGRMQRKSGLKLNIPQPVEQTAEPRSIPPSVARAMERVLPESSSEVMKELDEHLLRSANYIDQQLQPDAEILEYDQLAIAHIIRVENSRKANLNLTLCNSVSDVISQLEADQAPSHKRFIFRDENIGKHYSFADVSVKPGAPASIILLESADLDNHRNRALYEEFAQNAKMSPALADLRMGIIDVNIQRSPADCLIFCLSFALKSDKHADLFTKWHDTQHSGLSFSHPENGVRAGMFSEMGFSLYPSSLLPADFIKHTHSRAVIQNRLDSLHADDLATRDMLTRKILAKEPRLTEEGTLDYLPSIEYKRQDLIARALNVIAPGDMQSAQDNSRTSGEQNSVATLPFPATEKSPEAVDEAHSSQMELGSNEVREMSPQRPRLKEVQLAPHMALPQAVPKPELEAKLTPQLKELVAACEFIERLDKSAPADSKQRFENLRQVGFFQRKTWDSYARFLHLLDPKNPSEIERAAGDAAVEPLRRAASATLEALKNGQMNGDELIALVYAPGEQASPASVLAPHRSLGPVRPLTEIIFVELPLAIQALPDRIKQRFTETLNTPQAGNITLAEQLGRPTDFGVFDAENVLVRQLKEVGLHLTAPLFGKVKAKLTAPQVIRKTKYQSQVPPVPGDQGKPKAVLSEALERFAEVDEKLTRYSQAMTTASIERTKREQTEKQEAARRQQKEIKWQREVGSSLAAMAASNQEIINERRVAAVSHWNSINRANSDYLHEAAEKRNAKMRWQSTSMLEVASAWSNRQVEERNLRAATKVASKSYLRISDSPASNHRLTATNATSNQALSGGAQEIQANGPQHPRSNDNALVRRSGAHAVAQFPAGTKHNPVTGEFVVPAKARVGNETIVGNLNGQLTGPVVVHIPPAQSNIITAAPGTPADRRVTHQETPMIVSYKNTHDAVSVGLQQGAQQLGVGVPWKNVVNREIQFKDQTGKKRITVSQPLASIGKK